MKSMTRPLAALASPIVAINRYVSSHQLLVFLFLLLSTAVAIAALSFVLVTEAIASAESIVVRETSHDLANALQEMVAAANRGLKQGILSEEDYRRISFKVLDARSDLQGGFFVEGKIVGYSSPTHAALESNLRLPEFERLAVRTALDRHRAGGPREMVVREGKDLIVVLVSTAGQIDAWTMKRLNDFADPGESRRRHLLLLLATTSLFFVLVITYVALRFRKSVQEIRSGLEQMATLPDYRLSASGGELAAVAVAINQMADSRQRLEQELRREDRLRAMGRVVAGIAHEIKNPLNCIRLSLQTIARTHKPGEGQEEVQIALAEVDRMTRLLDSLLLFRTQKPANLVSCPIQPVLDRVLSLVQQPAIEKEVRIQQQIQDPSLAALIDPDCLQQSLMNLLLNAIEATPRGGSVRVNAYSDAGSTIISVADTGPGLTEEQQEHLFEAFYTTKQRGTGLGLAVTRELVQKLGGTITYRNTGDGAQFDLKLRTA